VLKTAISSAWLWLVHFLAAVREKFLQLMGKFLDWLMNRKTKSTSAGRPTIDDDWLRANRNSLVDMLSCWWGEIGWQLTGATTREALRAALEPVREHSNKHLISRLLLPSSDSANPDQIREGRDALGIAIEQIYEAQQKQREYPDFIMRAEMALAHASPEQKEDVKAKVSKLQADLQTATLAHEAACKAQVALEKGLDQMEAGFAQDQLLMFIDKRFINGRYARNPLNLANAMAGLPYTQGVHFLGAWQSYQRCSDLPCELWPHHRFQVFERIRSIFKKSQTSKLPPMEFFHQEIVALPRTVVTERVDPLTKKEVRSRSDNAVRSDLLDNWPIWSLAIKKSLESSVDQERIPFLICANFTEVRRDPKTSVLLVLGSTQKTKN
jgi:DNA-binding transcriptional MerR regulator